MGLADSVPGSLTGSRILNAEKRDSSPVLRVLLFGS